MSNTNQSHEVIHTPPRSGEGFAPSAVVSRDHSTIVRGRFPAIERTASDSAAFWEIFDRTIDEFFRTIDTSKRYIQRLTTQVAERDRRIELLQAQIDALREQADLQLGAPGPPKHSALQGATDGPTRTAEGRAHELADPGITADDRPRGIWSRLNRLERAPNGTRRFGE